MRNPELLGLGVGAVSSCFQAHSEIVYCDKELRFKKVLRFKVYTSLMCLFFPEPVFGSIFEGLLVLTDILKIPLCSSSVSVKGQPSAGQSTVRDTGSKLGHKPTNRNSMTQKLSVS